MRRRILPVLLGFLLGGCASQIQVNSGAVGLRVQSHTTAGALVTIGILAGAVYGESDDGGARYRGNPFVAIQPDSPRPVPPMDESRRVNEQDCSKPIEDRSANLRCR